MFYDSYKVLQNGGPPPVGDDHGSRDISQQMRTRCLDSIEIAIEDTLKWSCSLALHKLSINNKVMLIMITNNTI